MAWWSQNGWTKTLPKRRTKEERKADPDSENAKMVDAMHEAKYTSQDGGQNSFGTFSDEGLDYYADIGERLEERRTEHEAEYLEFEKQFRVKLCAKYGIDVNDPEGKKGKKGKRKSGSGKATKSSRKRKSFKFS